MLWFTVWLALVLLTLLGAFLLGRRLWRSAKALLADLEEAGRMAGRLQALEAELAEEYPRPTPPVPDLAADEVAQQRFHAMRHEHKAAVRRRRRARLARAARHWRTIA